jgi:hypothetical protein
MLRHRNISPLQEHTQGIIDDILSFTPNVKFIGVPPHEEIVFEDVSVHLTDLFKSDYGHLNLYSFLQWVPQWFINKYPQMMAPCFYCVSEYNSMYEQ